VHAPAPQHALATAAPLTVLVTGFGPFPGAPFNPTEALVRKLTRLRRPAFADVRLVGHVFRTSYAAVDVELPELLARHRPQVVLMFGLAARTRHVRVETCARNIRSRLLADVAGTMPAAYRLDPGAPRVRRGRAPFEALRVAARARGADVRLSHNAGRYLCNYLYWRAAAGGAAGSRAVVFVHVPLLRTAPARTRGGARRRMTADDLLGAGEAILRRLIGVARKP
jgi:pyroglutamyl-peptidase